MSEFLPPVVGRLLGDARDFTSKMGEARSQFAGTTSDIESKSGAMSKRVGTSMMAVGGLATGAGAALEHLGHSLEVAHGGLEVAVKNAGQSMEHYKSGIDEVVKRQEHFGHGAADSETALTILTRATGNTSQSLKDMALVTELAAVHHTSLADAAGIVAKMHAGAFKSLKEFGINVKDAAAGSKELAAAQKGVVAADTAEADASTKLTELHARLAGVKKLSVSQTQQLHHAEEKATETADAATKAHARLEAATKAGGAAMDFNTAAALIMKKAHGTAESQANTFGGRLDAVKTKLTDMASVVGAKVGPAMVAAGPMMMGVGSVISSGLLPKIGSLIASMAGAAAGAVSWAASTVAAGASAVGSFVADTAIMIGQAAVWAASMIAAGVSAAVSWGISMAGMAASAVVAGVAMLLPFLPIILAVGAVIAIGYLLYRNWDTIWSAVKAVAHGAWEFLQAGFHAFVGFFEGVGRGIGEVVEKIVGFFTGLPGRIASITVGLFDGIKTAFKAAINFIIRGWNSLHFGIPAIDTHIPGIGKVGGFDVGVPQIPQLDVGGLITGAGWADIHKNERVFMPEGAAVAPLPRGGWGGGGDTHVHLHLSGPVFGGDKQKIAQDLVGAFRTELIRTGGRQSLGLPA